MALAIAVTATITTNAYASDDVLNSISAGEAKKVSVSQDSGSGASSKGMVAVSESKGKKSDTNKQGSATKVKSGRAIRLTITYQRRRALIVMNYV